MRRDSHVVGVSLLAVLALTAVGRAESANGSETDRQKLEQVRNDPELYARLRQSLEVFLGLSPDRQEQLRRLDEDLHRKDPATRAKLLDALDRYSHWYDRLGEADRQAIDQADTPEQRLQVVRQIRERQWIASLPRADRERINNAEGKERQQLIRKLREREKQSRREWAFALSRWDEMQRVQRPLHVKDLPPAIRIYVDDFLRPVLTAKERGRLEKAEGTNSLAPTVLQLVEQHPVYLPGPSRGVSSLADLPRRVRQQLIAVGDGTMVRLLRGTQMRWPDFAVWVSYVAEHHHIALPRPLGPSRPKEFDSRMQQFIAELERKLTPAEKSRLRKAEGRWPLYPRVLMELAESYRLQPPEKARFDLPGSPEYWTWLGMRPPKGTR